jgi:hypothetical protein
MIASWLTKPHKLLKSLCLVHAEGDYQKWVIVESSGVLCVDEVYEDKLALLLAVDPAAPDGDRLVGYQLLVHGRVERKDIEKFLSRLRQIGVDPEEVITDGSPLYPAALKEVWLGAPSCICFTKRVL